MFLPVSILTLFAAFSISMPTPAPARCACLGGGGSQISVTLTGGANAGTYTATSPEATCSMGLTGPKSFGNQYSAGGKADKEFSSLQLIVDDADAAHKGTDKFYLKVAFGKRLVGTKYEISGSDNSMAGKKQGKGKATLSESGGKKVLVIEGETANGVKIKATLTCLSVLKMVNGQMVEQ